MKHLLITLAFVCGVTYSADSQVLIALLFGDKLNSPDLEFGVSFGESFSTMSNVSGARYSPNFSIGLYFKWRLNDHLYLQPEVLVKSTSGARRIDTYSVGDSLLDLFLVDANLERRLGYFQVPILLHYRLDNGLGASAGIQPALGTKAKDVFSDEVFEKNDLIFEFDVRDQYKRLDFGFTGELSWKPNITKGVTILGRYTYGVVDVLKDNPGKPVRNSAFLVAVLVPIGAKSAERERQLKELENSQNTPDSNK